MFYNYLLEQNVPNDHIIKISLDDDKYESLKDKKVLRVYAEQNGHGVPTVLKAYGERAYFFDGIFIKVIIPFDKNGFTTQEKTQNY